MIIKFDFSKFIPAQGKLLLSEPFMNDPNFRRTVVLLAAHNEEGSVGFVLNRPMELRLGQVVEELEGNLFSVWSGGPVQRDALFYVHTLGDIIPDSIPISENLYWNGNFETVKALIKGKKILENEIRLFIGYSGWGPGQLDEEIRRNSWIVAPATVSLVMNTGKNANSNFWQDILKSMGKEFGIIANFPENPIWN